MGGCEPGDTRADTRAGMYSRGEAPLHGKVEGGLALPAHQRNEAMQTRAWMGPGVRVFRRKSPTSCCQECKVPHPAPMPSRTWPFWASGGQSPRCLHGAFPGFCSAGCKPGSDCAQGPTCHPPTLAKLLMGFAPSLWAFHSQVTGPRLRPQCPSSRLCRRDTAQTPARLGSAHSGRTALPLCLWQEGKEEEAPPAQPGSTGSPHCISFFYNIAAFSCEPRLQIIPHTHKFIPRKGQKGNLSLLCRSAGGRETTADVGTG